MGPAPERPFSNDLRLRTGPIGADMSRKTGHGWGTRTLLPGTPPARGCVRKEKAFFPSPPPAPTGNGPRNPAPPPCRERPHRKRKIGV